MEFCEQWGVSFPFLHLGLLNLRNAGPIAKRTPLPHPNHSRTSIIDQPSSMADKGVLPHRIGHEGVNREAAANRRFIEFVQVKDALEVWNSPWLTHDFG